MTKTVEERERVVVRFAGDSGDGMQLAGSRFTKRNLEKAGYTSNPLEDESLSAYRVHRIPMTTLTVAAVEEIEDASTRDAGRAKNLFALGVISWLYGRPTDGTKRWIEKKFAK